jgi:hypothetical protein
MVAAAPVLPLFSTIQIASTGACDFRHDIGEAPEYFGVMGTLTLRQSGRLEDVAPVVDLGEIPDLDVDARFWAAIDLMNSLLTDG